MSINHCDRSQAASEDWSNSEYVTSNIDRRRVSVQPAYYPAKVSDEEDFVDDSPTIAVPDKTMQTQTEAGIECDIDTDKQWIATTFESSDEKVRLSTVSEILNASERWISSSHEHGEQGYLKHDKITTLQRLRLLQLEQIDSNTKGQDIRWSHSNSPHEKCVEPWQEVVPNQITYSRILGLAIIGVAILLVSPWLLLLILHALNDILCLIGDVGNQHG